MKHILLVDDSIANLKLAKAALEPEFKVTLLTSGEQMLAYLTNRSTDLILLDIEMPGLSGFDVVDKLKSSGRMEIAPIIFLTALINPEVEAKALSMGVVDFINKPFARESLVQRVRLHLEINDYRKDLEHKVEEAVQRLAKVTAERERIHAELDIARQIQASLLPCVFPAYPDCREFDIYAAIAPAKEVGGDFYDFFLIDRDHLGVVIADVSGKGVPAALFMMVAKTLIKNHAFMNLTPAEILTKANRQLCENNDVCMFVTVFMGILNIRSGKFTFVNAGHNFPLVRHANGPFGWLESKVRLVLGYTDSARYDDNVILLKPGDTLFLYTDGVTEAENDHQEMFGNERLMKQLNAGTEAEPRDMLTAVKRAVDTFARDVPQHDDITMLVLKWAGTP